MRTIDLIQPISTKKEEREGGTEEPHGCPKMLRLQNYFSRLKGLKKGLAEVLENRPELSSYVSILRILDYFQYTNPPYVQKQVSEDLGEPQSKISQLVESLEKKGVRIRLDYSHVPLGLRLLVVMFESTKARADRLPLIDWVSTVLRSPKGLIITYRVPATNMQEAVDIIETRAELMSASTGRTRITILRGEDSLLARPSLEYWLYRVFDEHSELEEIDPINAFDLLDDHPRRIDAPDSLDLYEDIEFNLDEPHIGFRDMFDLVLLSYMEASIFHTRSRNLEDLLPKRFGKPRLQVELHESHLRAVARGSKVSMNDLDPEEGNVILCCVAWGSQRELRTLSRDLKKHPYVYTLAKLEEEGLFFTMTIPVAFTNKLAIELRERYGVDIDLSVVTVKDLLLRQGLPYRNYNQLERSWDFRNTVKTVLLNYLRGYVEKRREVHMNIREYVEKAKSSYGEDLLLEAARDLGYESIDELIDEIEKIEVQNRR
ncbi:MAG: hypothetical protein QW206_03785 [Acidilobaceae archaeon]